MGTLAGQGHRPRARARAVGLVTVLSATLLVASANAGAQEDEPPDLSATSLAPAERVTSAKSLTGRLAQTDPELLGRTDATPEPVMIKFDYDPLASYQGGVADLAATSPTVTGVELTGTTPAEQAYERYVAAQEGAIVGEIAGTVPAAQVRDSFRIVYGGVSAVLPANRVADVLAIDGVVAVQKDSVRQPLTDSSPEFIGAPTLYNELGTTAEAGAGIIYGNLDTGVWPEHASFADLGNMPPPPGPARECKFGDNPLTPANDPFVCNNKLIGGAHFTDTYDELAADDDDDVVPDPYGGTARDFEGHGTHTASTSAGNIVESAEVFGVDRGPIHGIAPGAWVMEYKVCGPDGCFNSDSARAVAQAIVDGVDVINFSVGGGEQPFSDPVELAFLDAYAAGVFVAASAGNDGPDASTADHLSPWVTTVGASTQTREFATTLDITAGDGDTFTVDGASITAGAGPLPVVMAGDIEGYEDPLCGEEPAPGVFDGLIVACERGVQARVWKSFVVFSGGGEGMVLYNPTLQDTETDNHWVPTIHVADGTQFVAFMESHEGMTGGFAAGEPRDGQGDVMAAFSSRGPGGLFVKPDITAPGVQILAGNSPTQLPPNPEDGGSPQGQFFQAIAGTSMSSPHIAGSAILLAARHPDWTPGQIKSAMMTTATTDVVKEDLVTPADPLDMGAGRVDLKVAGSATLTFDETAANFFALGNDPVNAVHLNLPSVNAPVMPGRLTTTRVATNVSGRKQQFTTSAESDAGTITVEPRRFKLEPGQSATITIAIETTEPPGTQHFGAVHITSNHGDPLHLPVAFVPRQGEVTLTQSCTPETIQRRGTTECDVVAVNNQFTDTVVDLRTEVDERLRLTGAEGATLLDDRHAELNVELTAAEPGVPDVAPGELFGYVPLEDFDVTPEPIGDEEVLNLNVPAFRFAGEEWARVGVDSNGYLIVGGGGAEDNNCCTLPAGPDPERPNNVLAPFWTDLDGTGAPGILATVLSEDDDNSWLVIEYQVNVFGTSDLRTFQVWIGLNGVEDITYAYASVPQEDPNGQDFLVGAENRLGQGDMAAVLPTADLRVTSTEFVPGGSVSYTVIAEGRRPGIGRVTTSMQTDAVPGTTVVNTDVTIQPGRPAPKGD